MHGADKATRWLLGVVARHGAMVARPATVNGQPVVALCSADRTVLDSIAVLDIDEHAQIVAIRLIRNPEKPRHLVPRWGQLAAPGD